MPHSPPGPTAAPGFGGSTAPRHLAQYDHADLGLVDDDNTEEMRKPPALQAEGFQNHTQLSRKASS